MHRVAFHPVRALVHPREVADERVRPPADAVARLEDDERAVVLLQRGRRAEPRDPRTDDDDRPVVRAQRGGGRRGSGRPRAAHHEQTSELHRELMRGAVLVGQRKVEAW